jgi:hypothetical protein
MKSTMKVHEDMYKWQIWLKIELLKVWVKYIFQNHSPHLDHPTQEENQIWKMQSIWQQSSNLNRYHLKVTLRLILFIENIVKKW